MSRPSAAEPPPRSARLRFFYPLAFALWPALSLYSVNIDHYRLEALLRPILVSAAVAALLHGILLVAFRQPALAAFKAFCALLVFVAGGLVCRGWRGITMASAPIELGWVAAVATVGLVLLTLGARPPRRFDRLPEILWVFSLVLLALPVATVIRVELARARVSVPRGEALDLGGTADTHPHIFYLVLDGYAREDVLRDLYGHDNGPFLETLRERGCYVASEALANYPQTALSLASSLNMDYLDEWTGAQPPGSSDRSILRKAINESRVVAALRSSGYTFAAFATGYWPAEARSADRFISLTAQRLFWRGFLATTPLPDLFPSVREAVSGDEQHRREILHTFEGVGPLAGSSEPLFVLAHVIVPHPPFVFDATGGLPPTRRASFTLGDGDAWRANARKLPEDYRREYVAQLRYVNSMTMAAIDAIRGTARRPVVIIVQADHGPGSELDFRSAERTNLRERLGILNAYCFPDEDFSDLYPGMSPVNSFRVVLGRIRGRPVPLLPDRTYFATWSRPFDYQLLRVDPDGELRVTGSPP